MNLITFAGTDDPEEALKMWQAEREAMLRLHDENTALRIHNRRLRVALLICSKVFDLLDGSMFLPNGAGEKITKAREQIKIVERSVNESKVLCE
jgi:hypothetical protein